MRQRSRPSPYRFHLQWQKNGDPIGQIGGVALDMVLQQAADVELHAGRAVPGGEVANLIRRAGRACVTTQPVEGVIVRRASWYGSRSPPLTPHDVVALTTINGIVAIATHDEVIALATIQGIVACTRCLAGKRRAVFMAFCNAVVALVNAVAVFMTVWSCAVQSPVALVVALFTVTMTSSV